MTQTSLRSGIGGVSPFTAKNQKNDIAYLTELVSEIKQLDSLVALNESRRRLSAVSLQHDEALMEALGGGYLYDPMDYCSQSAVKRAREILVREIREVEHRLESGAKFNNDNNSCMGKTAFPFGDIGGCGVNVFGSEGGRQSKVVKFAKLEHKAGGDASAKKKFRKSSLLFPRPQKKGKEEPAADKKDVDEGLGETQNDEKPMAWSVVTGRNSSEKSTSVVSDELENDEYGKIVEKITNNANFRMCCKILFPPMKKKTEENNYNMIGRILGPRGISIRQTEAKFDCRILIRGKGSVKNPQDEARLRLTPAGKHLNEELHVLITVEKPYHDQCLQKMTMAKAFIEQLLATPDFDEFKRNQLIQLAIINGTYRNTSGGNKGNGNCSSAPPISSAS